MDRVRRRPPLPHRLRAGIVAVALALVTVGAATLVLTRRDVAPPRPDNSPIFAGSEPIDARLQQVYAQAPLGAPSVPGADQWSQFGADAAHSFASPSVGGHRPRGRVAWFAPLGGPVLSAPVVDHQAHAARGPHGTQGTDGDAIVYVGGSDGFLRALDARTGRLRWRVGLGDSLTDSSPAVGGGRIYVGGFGTLTLAFDATTGRPLWQADNKHPLTAPPTYVRGLVLVPSDGNFLSCYDAATGRLYWRFQSEDALPDFWPTTGAAAATGRTAYVALGASAEFMAIDLVTGLKRWEYAVRERFSGAPALAHGAVYVATASGRILCFDAADGALRWEATLPRGVGEGTRSSPVVAGGRLFLGGDDGRLYAFSARTGHRLWTFRTGAPVLSVPIVAASDLYLPGGDGLLYRLDAASGRERWALRLGEMRAAPALLDGTLYVGSREAGGLYAVT